MGQIFYSCAYDIDTKTCCVIDADKFNANCYAHNSTVCSMHYLLRQKPYRIMWGGNYVTIDDIIANYSSEEDLLGLSTYLNYNDVFESSYEDSHSKSYYDIAKFIGNNIVLWNHISVWDEAKKYFNWDKTRSVSYNGYLVNHTKKLAVDLEDYFMRSLFLIPNGEITAIDALPVLTETGGGTQMALIEGVTVDSTEELAGTWCGDLLQIVEALPEGYEIIDCCFTDIWGRAEYCYRIFGVDEQGRLLRDKNGNLYSAARLNGYGKRGPASQFTIETSDDGILFKSVRVDTKGDTCS